MAIETVNPIDRESIVGEAASITDLVTWVARARDLIDQIQGYANCSPSFKKELEAGRIAYNNADWMGGDVGDAMANLLLHQYKLIKSLA